MLAGNYLTPRPPRFINLKDFKSQSTPTKFYESFYNPLADDKYSDRRIQLMSHVRGN